MGGAASFRSVKQLYVPTLAASADANVSADVVGPGRSAKAVSSTERVSRYDPGAAGKTNAEVVVQDTLSETRILTDALGPGRLSDKPPVRLDTQHEAWMDVNLPCPNACMDVDLPETESVRTIMEEVPSPPRPLDQQLVKAPQITPRRLATSSAAERDRPGTPNDSQAVDEVRQNSSGVNQSENEMSTTLNLTFGEYGMDADIVEDGGHDVVPELWSATAWPGKRDRSGFACTFGSTGGVKTLSLQPGLRSEVKLLASTLQQTLSAGAAVRGARLTWVRGEEIGRGSMAAVFRALDQRTGEVIAVKEIPINASSEQDKKLQAALENELAICKTLRHPRIVSFLGHDYIDGSLYVYVEYMPGGSLAEVLSQFGALEEPLIRTYAREMAEGLEYLHAQEPPVLHRDIKGANVLVGLDCKVKLADFGCSKRCDVDSSLAYTMKGSIPWMAPEVIMKTGYGRPADIWSLGCVTIEMATARSPWGKLDNIMQAMRLIGMTKECPPVPTTLSEDCVAFVSACTRRDKHDRLSASQALQHPFFVSAFPQVFDF